MLAGATVRVVRLSAGLQRPGTYVQFVYYSTSQEERVARVMFCWKCGPQPVRSLPVPRYTSRVPVVVGVENFRPHRRQFLAAIEGHRGPVRRSRVADGSDAFVPALSAASRCWQASIRYEVFNAVCFFDTHGNVPNNVNVTVDPVAGHRGDVIGEVVGCETVRGKVYSESVRF